VAVNVVRPPTNAHRDRLREIEEKPCCGGALGALLQTFTHAMRITLPELGAIPFVW